MRISKKLLSVLLCVVIVLGMVLSAFAAVGVIYNDSYGEVTITGTGEVNEADVYNAVGNDLSKIRKVVIGEGVISLGDKAFKGCSNLESISLPSTLTSLGDSAFYDCVSLESIAIPPYVTEIKDDTFSGCNNLKSVSMPGVEKIGKRAFYGCFALTSVVIPPTIGFCTSTADPQLNSYSIGDNAFASCSKLVSAFVPALPDTDYSYEQRSIFHQNTIMLVYSLSGATANITQAIGNTDAKCIHIPDRIISWNIRSISADVFGSYYKMTTAFIPDISADNVFPASTAIFVNGGESVRGNVNAPSITIPASVTSIAEGAFTGLENLRVINVEEGNPAFILVDGVLYAKDAQGNPGTLICYPPQKTDLDKFTVPDGVTAINTLAFYSCYILKEITIPSGVSSIGSHAFKQCSRLKTITVSSDNDNYVSIDGVLYKKNVNGNPEKLIYYPPKKTGAAFEIPAGVTEIGDYAFEDCINLKTVEIPDSVTSIGKGAFSGCSGIADIEIPDSVTDIGESAFAGISIKQITIPDSVTSIGSSAFEGFLNVIYSENMTASGSPWGAKFANKYYEAPLVYENEQKQALIYCDPDDAAVTIPVTVSTISFGAFTECAGLTDVFLPAGFNNSDTGTVDPGTGTGTGTVSPFDPGTGTTGPVDPGTGPVYGVRFPEGTNVWKYSVSAGAENSLDGLTYVSIPARYRGNRDYIYCDAMGEGYRIDSVAITEVDLLHSTDCPDFAPFEIDSYEKLLEFASQVNGGNNRLCAVLTEDIDAPSSAQANDWEPLGNQYNPYVGIFDGNGYKITGLTVNNANREYAGLFGYVGESGIIRNVGLEDGSITGKRYVGGVAGYSEGEIDNCYNTGNIAGLYYVGGLVGCNTGKITRCSNAGDITGDYNYVGGIAGGLEGVNTDSERETKIMLCCNSGNITGIYCIGGLFGIVKESSFDTLISMSYNTGNVCGDKSVGGVGGRYEGALTATACYNMGEVTSIVYAGGIIGDGFAELYCYYCLSAGSFRIKEENTVYLTNGNGAIGLTPASATTLTYKDNEKPSKFGGISSGAINCICCYYDVNKASGFSAFGGNSTQSGGLTTAQMTGAAACENMGFAYEAGEENPWLTRANDGSFVYYPHLKGFNLDEEGNQLQPDEINAEDWPAKTEPPKADPVITLSVTPEQPVYGDDIIITATLPENATGTVTLAIEDKKLTAPVDGDGTATFTIPGLTPGEHDVSVSYGGDDNYNAVTEELTVEIPKYSFTVTLEISPEEPVYGDDVTIIASLPADATGTVTVNVDGNDYIVPVTDGEAVCAVENLEPGTHTVTVSYSGDDKYNSASQETSVAIPKCKCDINVETDPEQPVYGDDVTIITSLPDDSTGDITLTVDGKDYAVPIKDGKAVISFDDLGPGEHTVDVAYPGDDKYYEVSAFAEFSVNKAKAEIAVTVSPENPYTTDELSITATLSGDAIFIDYGPNQGGSATLFIDEKEIEFLASGTNEVTFTIAEGVLSPGEHTINVRYNGDDNHYSCDSEDITVNIVKCLHENTTTVSAKKPTCTEEGNNEYTHCNNCNRDIDKLIIPALGHTWNAPVWNWDDVEHPAYTTSCSVCEAEKTGEADSVTSNDTPATVEADGYTTYTATVTLGGQEFTDNHVVTDEGSMLEARKDTFDEYKGDAKEDADALAQDGDSEEIGALIEAAKDAINALAYDESKTLDENKAAVDEILAQLKDDIAEHRKEYTATFIADGEKVDEVTFTIDTDSITEPEVPAKEGNTGVWEEYTLGAEDITVNAVYTVNEYTITYVIDGNETEVTYKYGAAVEKPADPVKDGFNFIGWDAEIPETMPAENLTITALFEAIPEPEEPTPTEPTPTEPTPTEPTPTEPTPTEPTPTEPTPTEPTPTEPTPTDTEPAHEHDYKGEVTTKPTCTEDGIMTYTCECGESYTQAIPKTGHKPGEWEVVTPATTEAAGKEVKKCEVCGEVIAEREIAKLAPDTADAEIVSVNLEKLNDYGIANAFGVDPGKLPAGSTVTWYVNGEKAGEGNGYRVDNPTENYTIKAVVTNRDGKVIGETEETTVKVNNCFFARLYYWLCRIIQKVIDLFKGK